ncbi:MAG: 50S ribosomal protein L22 [Clostridiales bacterium]|nr:50S ribosomal protein L22 [Clostridiales bacterium]
MAKAQDAPAARAQARFVRISPSKVRIVLDLVRGKDVAEAIALLDYVPKRAARVVQKLVKSAAANAVTNHHMDEDRLYVAEAYADQAPTLKRYHPVWRGQAYPILKRQSHITIVVRERGEG